MAKTYGDNCGIARALDIVGERWMLLVVRELVLGPKRFKDLQTALPRVATDVLSRRLRDLVSADLVQRETMPPPAGSRVYALTDRGHELEPVLLALGRFGSAEPMPDVADAVFGADAAIIALPTTFVSERAPADRLTVELDLGAGTPYIATIADGGLHVARGSAADPDARIAGSPHALAALVWHGAALDTVDVSGSRRAVRRFLRCFVL